MCFGIDSQEMNEMFNTFPRSGNKAKRGVINRPKNYKSVTGRQRESIVKRLRSLLSAEFLRYYVSSGRTQCRVAPEW